MNELLTKNGSGSTHHAEIILTARAVEPSPSCAVWYRAARRTAVVAIVYCLIVLALMIANSFHNRASDPMQAVRLTTLQHELDLRPQDQRLRNEVRRLDRQIRTNYFRGRAFAWNGLYLLLGGMVVYLLALEVARQCRRELPRPAPEVVTERWMATALSLRSVTALGTVLGGLLITLAVLSRHDSAAEYARAAMTSPIPGKASSAIPGAIVGTSTVAKTETATAPGSSLPPPPAPAASAGATSTENEANESSTSGALPPPPSGSDSAPMPLLPPPPLTSGSTPQTGTSSPVPSSPTTPPTMTNHPGPTAQKVKPTKSGTGSRIATLPPQPILASASMTVTAAYPEAWAKQWPIFRGPAGVGVATTGEAPTDWDGARGQSILWKVQVPLPGWNSPVVWNDKVFLTGGNKQTREVYCFATSNGALLWKKSVPIVPGTVKLMEDTGYAPSTVATDGRGVWAIFVDGTIVGFDTAGKQLWLRRLGIPQNAYGHASSLTLHEGLVIVQMDQGTDPEEGKSVLMALDGATGKTRWQVKRPVQNSWTTPIVVRVSDASKKDVGREELITVSDPLVIAYDPHKGTELWRFDGIKGDVTSCPVFTKGLIITGGPSSPLMALRPGGQGDLTRRASVWQYQDNLPDIPSPVATEDLVFMVSSEGIVTCLEASSGKKLWEHDYEISFRASPALIGNHVYLTDYKGITHVFEAGRNYKAIGEAPLGEACNASPAFAGGRIYMRGAQNLYCIGPTQSKVAREINPGGGRP